MNDVFALPPPSNRVYLPLLLMVPLGVGFTVLTIHAPWKLKLVLVPALLLIAAVTFYLAYSPGHVRVELTDDSLRIRGEIYGRTIPLSVLQLDKAREMNVESSGYIPLFKTNGTGLPGYWAGWFVLRNTTKALVFLTDRRHVMVIPHKDGWVLMISVVDNQGLLTRLQSHH